MEKGLKSALLYWPGDKFETWREFSELLSRCKRKAFLAWVMGERFLYIYAIRFLDFNSVAQKRGGICGKVQKEKRESCRVRQESVLR